MESQKPILCPSAQCQGGAILLGIILPDRTVAYADRRLRIDAHQAQQMHLHAVAPEKSFRFSSPCAQSGCRRWREGGCAGKCGALEDALSAPLLKSLRSALPECAIRSQCRWFQQSGAKACGLCRYVATDCAVLTEVSN